MFGLVRFEGHILIKDCTQLVRLRIQVLRIFGPLRNGYLEQISPRKIPHATWNSWAELGHVLVMPSLVGCTSTRP